MKTARITCPACEQPIELPARMRGQFLKCPACAQGFRIPGAPPRPLAEKIFLIAVLPVVGTLVWLCAHNGDAAELLRALLFFFGGAILYFIPWLVAARNGHRQVQAIGILNLVAGWTFIGWVAALVWANVKPAK